MSGLLQKRLRLLGVVLALRELVARVRGIERRVDVVPDEPVAGEALLHDLRAVDEEAERPPHAHVVEGRGVDPHAQRRPRARRGDEDLLPATLHDGHLRERDVRHRLDLPGQQRVDLGRVGGEVDDPHLVEVRLAVDPVVLVLHVDALPSRSEALDLERPGPDVLQRALADRVRLVALRDDALEVLGERLHQRHVRAGQEETACVLVELLDAARGRSLRRLRCRRASASVFFVRLIE